MMSMGFQIADCGFQIADFRFQISDLPSVSSASLRFRLRIAVPIPIAIGTIGSGFQRSQTDNKKLINILIINGLSD
jgi:hypothetical protein